MYDRVVNGAFGCQWPAQRPLLQLEITEMNGTETILAYDDMEEVFKVVKNYADAWGNENLVVPARFELPSGLNPPRAVGALKYV